MIALVQTIPVGENLFVDLARILVLSLTSAVFGIGIGLLHRWYANQKIPDGLSVLVGLSVVALYLNTSGALGDVIGGQKDLLGIETVVFNVFIFLISGVMAAAGGRSGDRLGVSLFAVARRKSVEADVSRIVKTVGRVTTVKIPDDIDDIDGYDPVDSAVKENLADQTLLFPRRLTVGELRGRFIERLKTDYDVGHVDVDFTENATIEYLALGSRESGLGPTLPPESAALAIWADPANDASPGDAVQVWTTGDPATEAAPERVTNAEVRGTADDVVTLTMDEEAAMNLDTDVRYRLVTLPVEARTDREFAAQLRAAEETMGVVDIEAGSALAESTIGALDVAVAAIRTQDGEIEAIPHRSRPLASGETIYAIARPDRLRRLEAAATAETTAVVDDTADSGA
ncbi:MAG: hypothetical protein ACI8UR_001645 [Natronomonas sp.]|jgi:hypothetical protein|uniref:potassium transporter TrkA n=1 Tax=Natronomonas sp. TaxID=2184060 RepID=UPI003989E194